MKEFKSTALALALVLSLVYVNALAQGPEPMPAPEGIPVESEWLYGKHYEQVQEIMALPLGQREAALESYMKKLDRKAKIHGYMSGFFAQVVESYRAASRTSEADKLQAHMFELFPSLKPGPGQEFQTAFQAKDYAKAIPIGEKLYADTSDKQVAVMLAQAYIATKNGPKAVEFCNKAVDILGNKEGIYYLSWLADYYSAQNQAAQAILYYDKMYRAYPNTVPSGWDEKRWTQTLAKGFLLKASDLYAQKDYKGAIESFYKSLEMVPRNEQAYLYIGLSHWKVKEFDEAMGAFAVATVLNKSNSAKAREYLEQLFKARNGGSLDGLEDLLAQARRSVN